MAGLYIGLMSGTSLDGVDAVAMDFDSQPWQVVAQHYEPFDPELKEALLAMATGQTWIVNQFQATEAALTTAYANIVRNLLRKSHLQSSDVQAIGCHGQTLRHWPDCQFTYQMLNPSLLAEQTGIAVACDFRRRDMAAGGQGAPLVPAFQADLLDHIGQEATLLNLGGIANITCRTEQQELLAFDTGPANTLMDAYCREFLNRDLDANGALAAKGTPLAEPLKKALSDPYFRKPPPKSTGPEYFNLAWAKLQFGADLKAAPEDILATFCALSAIPIADAVKQFATGSRLLVFGGGRHNECLMREIGRYLPDHEISDTDSLGVSGDFLEAAAFAWLALQLKNGRPGNAPSATGACGPRVLGGWYPA